MKTQRRRRKKGEGSKEGVMQVKETEKGRRAIFNADGTWLTWLGPNFCPTTWQVKKLFIQSLLSHNTFLLTCHQCIGVARRSPALDVSIFLGGLCRLGWPWSTFPCVLRASAASRPDSTQTYLPPKRVTAAVAETQLGGTTELCKLSHTAPTSPGLT